MRDNLTRGLKGFQSTFAGFTAGQKVVAIIGTAALLLAGFLVFRWAATPAYSPLYSNLAASDASAVIQELDSQGIGYKLSNGGNTIMVPADQVYSTRISLSGQGLPTSSEGGYSILDKQGLSTSQFQERTDFKRAMEGELSKTIEAIDGVDAAVVHLAMPEKDVFSEAQDPTTASVLVKTRAGLTMGPEQVQAIVNLVSSSVDGLDTDKVTVADATGKVLSSPGAAGTGGYTQNQNQLVIDYQNRLSTDLQNVLDKVLGPGNSTNQITAQLSFDKTVSESTDYRGNGDLTLSESEKTQKLTNGAAGATAGVAGVLGPDGQTDAAAEGGPGSRFTETERVADPALDKTVETREAAPGKLERLGVGVVLDTRALAGRDPAEIEALVTSALALDTDRGDAITVSSLPFDRTTQDLAAQELEASQKAEARAERMSLIRNGGLIGLVALMVLAAWIQSRKRAKARAQATEYVVEQLRRDAQDRQALAAAPLAVETNPALLALESSQADESQAMRDEIAALVERQPEDVAQLLRGWLVERGA